MNLLIKVLLNLLIKVLLCGAFYLPSRHVISTRLPLLVLDIVVDVIMYV